MDEHTQTRIHQAVLDRLTAKEWTVLRGLLRGYAPKAIAQQLGRSVRTIRMHRAQLFKKCGVVNEVQLLRRLDDDVLSELGILEAGLEGQPH